jgi:aryl-alcohol dehydrogenase-like predicted oxidoreductase
VVFNWVRQQPKAQVIPIPGARSAKQLKDNLGVLDWKLTEEKWKCLDEVNAMDLGVPHGFWMAIATFMARSTTR